MGNDLNNLSFRKEPLFLAVLGLILLNLFNVAIYFCYLLVPIIIIISRKRVKILDHNFFVILVFSVLYSVIILIYNIPVGVALFAGYLLFPPIFYYLGKYIVGRYPSYATIYFLFFFIGTVFSIMPFLANLRSILINGFMQERNLTLFWMEKDQVASATGIGSYFAINMALFPLIFVKKESDPEKKLLLFSVLLFAIGAISILNMSNRTGLLITMASTFFLIFIPQKNNARSLFIISLFLGAIIIIYIVDAFNFRSWFEFSRYFERLTNTSLQEEDSRYLIWKANFFKLLHNPLGYVNPDSATIYAHNMWLDVGRVAGIIPVIPLLVFTFSAVVAVAKIVLNRQFSVFFRVLIAGFGIAFFSTFFLEPVIEGMFTMFLLFCFYFGTIVGIRKYIPMEPG
jgi:hypothetical protein